MVAWENLSGCCHTQIAADFAGQIIADFGVTRDAGSGPRLRIEENGVPAALAKQFTTWFEQIADQIAPFMPFSSKIDGYEFPFGIPRAISQGQFPIGFDDHGKRFLQIPARPSQGATLCVYTWHLFHIGHVPFASLLNDGRELMLHGSMSLTDSADSQFARGSTMGCFHVSSSGW
jgi:hypothetical protein